MAKTKRYPGTIEKRGSNYRVILYAGGKRHSYTLKEATRKQAENFAREQHDKLQERLARVEAGLPGVVKFSGLLKQYREHRLPLVNSAKTRATYEGSLDRFEHYFVELQGDPEVDAIRRGHIRSFLDWRRANRLQGITGGHRRSDVPLSNRTVAKDRAVLHQLFTYAAELEYRDDNPVALVKVPKGDPRDPVILDDEQFERLLSELEDPMVRLYVLTLGEGGMRSESEALWLQWIDIDLEEGFIRIRSGRDGHRTKSGKGRWTPMTPRLREAMREHFANFRFATYDGQPAPWIFHHTRTRRHYVAGDRVKSFRTSITNAIKRAKLPDGFRTHDLRHRRITTWLAEGKNPVHVKEAVGHADLRTTMEYTHLAREHLRSLVGEEEAEERLKKLGS